MTVMMGGIRGLSAQPEAVCGKGNSHHVDDRFGCVGEDRCGPSHPVGKYFCSEHEEADRQRNPHGELELTPFIGIRNVRHSHRDCPNQELTRISDFTSNFAAHHNRRAMGFPVKDRITDANRGNLKKPCGNRNESINAQPTVLGRLYLRLFHTLSLMLLISANMLS